MAVRGAGPSRSVIGEGSYRYPEGSVADKSYFISELNFDLLAGAVATGGADKLVFLNQSNLQPLSVYSWTASDVSKEQCLDTISETPDFTCRNHIRVYKRLPSNSSLILVCGTNAVVEPSCRLLQLSTDDGGELEITEYDIVTASAGLLSNYPQFPQFGLFRNSSDEDTVFLSAGFFRGDNGPGRHFSISYKNITTTTTSDPNTLSSDELFRTINANNNWLTFPVTFVGVEKADYEVPAGSPPANYQFWFILLREKLMTGDLIHSRLVRVCRNDPGSMSDGDRHFTTFMKARIFCKKDKPSTLEFTDTLDFQYDSITSFVFSHDGRYYDNDNYPPQRLLYGSYAGAGNGPVGSALCVYPADNTGQRSTTVFDIFRQDIATDLSATPVENHFLQCSPEGRNEADQQLLFIKKDLSIEQIGDDPILILDDIIINTMVQDRVCVVTKDNPQECVDQDVLFLGLDSGHVYKVVFGLGEDGESFPIISEDFELDPTDPQNVTAMQLREVEGEKFLFVSTDTRIYKLPLERCNRFQNFNCSECVASRDPYCVYNNLNHTCEANKLNSTVTVDEWYKQNVHTGIVEDNCGSSHVDVIGPTSMTVDEGVGQVTFELRASRAVSINVAFSGSAEPTKDYLPLENSTIDLRYPGDIYKLNIIIIDDVALETDKQIIIILTSNEASISSSRLSVTIRNNDRLGVAILLTTSLSCREKQLKVDDELTQTVVKGLVEGTKTVCRNNSCQNFTTNDITNVSISVFCSESWAVLFQGQIQPTLEGFPSQQTIADAINKLVEQRYTLTLPSSDLKLTIDRLCDDITESDDDITNSCTGGVSTPTSTTTPSTGGLTSSDPDATPFIAAFAISFVINVIFVIVFVAVLAVYCMGERRKKNIMNRIKKYPRQFSEILTTIKRPVPPPEQQQQSGAGDDGGKSEPYYVNNNDDDIQMKDVQVQRTPSPTTEEGQTVNSLTPLVTRSIQREGIEENDDHEITSIKTNLQIQQQDDEGFYSCTSRMRSIKEPGMKENESYKVVGGGGEEGGGEGGGGGETSNSSVTHV